MESDFDFEIGDEDIALVQGQHLLFNKAFLTTMAPAYLAKSDIVKMAEACCRWLKSHGWFEPQAGVMFTVDAPIEMSKDFVFGHLGIEPIDWLPSIKVTALINGQSAQIQKAIVRLLEAHRDGRIDKSSLNVEDGLRGMLGMQIAHEMAHTFGIRPKFSRFQNMPLGDLEILTDASAYLSCGHIFKIVTRSGLPYLSEHLHEKGIENLTQATLTEVSETFVARCCPIKQSC